MRGAPGVVTVQENRATGTKHTIIPQNVLEDISFNARDLIYFHKVEGVQGWVLRKISREDLERIKQAYRRGENTGDVL